MGAEEESVNPLLMEYLDLDGYAEKKDFLRMHESELTKRLLNDIAVCEDVVLPDSSESEMISSLLFAVSTKARFEVRR